MARQRAYTDEQIVAAGEAIEAQGRVVNGTQLAVRLGGGNRQVLMRVWNRHIDERNGNGGARPINEPVDRPFDLFAQPDVVTHIEAVIDHARGQARRHVAAAFHIAAKLAQTQSAARIAQLEAELSAARRNEEAADSLASRYEDERDAAVEERDQARDESAELRNQVARLSAANAALNATASNLADQLARAREDISQQETIVTSLRDAQARLEQSLAGANTVNSALQRRLDEMTADMNALSAAKQAADEDRIAAMATAATLHEQLKSLESRANEIDDRYQDALGRAADALGSLHALKNQFTGAVRDVEVARREAKDLQAALESERQLRVKAETRLERAQRAKKLQPVLRKDSFD